MAENSETSSKGRSDHLHYTCTQDSIQTKGEVKYKLGIKQKNILIVKWWKKHRSAPPLLNQTDTPRAIVFMLEIAGHVATLTIHLIEKSEPKQRKWQWTQLGAT